jgi:hypothetical protein
MVKKVFVFSLQPAKARDEPASPWTLGARFQNRKRELPANVAISRNRLGAPRLEGSCRSNIQYESCLLRSFSAASDRTTMPKSFKIHDRVSWNSEAGRVSGTIIRVHTREFKVKGYTHHASPDDPQYEIKSSKTDHIAFHRGATLTKIGD